MYDTVLMAGGGKSEPLTEQAGVANKAFIEVEGRPLIAYILDSLVEAPSVGRINVVGPEDSLKRLRDRGYDFMITGERGSLLENVAAGLEFAAPDQLCFIVTADIPLLSSAVVERFIDSCGPYDSDLYYPIMERGSFDARMPGSVRTYVRLLEGEMTGGNIGMVRPGWYLENRHKLEMFIAYRKQPVKLAKILPLKLVWKYLFKRLSIADLEEFISRLLGLKARAILTEDIEIGIDVDKISDLDIVKSALKQEA